MQIIIDNESLDLRMNSSLEIEQTSPLFSDKGSMSVPITLPPTPKNQRLLGFPGRIDRATKLEPDRDVSVISGPLVRHGLLNIISGQIEANIGFDEGAAYAKMSSVKLADMDNLPVYNPGDISTHLYDVLQGNIEADYCIFPVITTMEEDDEKYYMAINEINDEGKFVGEKYRKVRIKIGNDFAEIDMPALYGISPFIRLHVLLHYIFEYFGYKLTENPFATHPQLSKLCVLNNCYDTVVTEKIDYRQLMPDCTIEDILDMIWCRFGAKYFVDSDTKTVRIRFIKDILSDNSFVDLSSAKSSPGTLSFNSFKQLRFELSKSGDRTETVTDTFEEYIKKCDGVIDELSHSSIKTNTKRVNTLDICTGDYYYKQHFESDTIRVSSSFFNWDKKDKNLAYEEIKTPDVSMCMIADVLNVPAPFLNAGEYHENTVLFMNSPTSNDSSDEKCGLHIAFALGESNFGSHSGLYYGSVFGRTADGSGYRKWTDDNGNIIDYFDLTYHGSHGMVHYFWEEYIHFMKHANQTVTQSFNLSPIQLAQLDFSKKIYIDGQLYLPESFTLILGQDSIHPVEIQMRTLRLQKPYDLNADIEIPKTEKQKYYWSISDSRQDLANQYAASLKWEYSERYNVNYNDVSVVIDKISEINTNQYLSKLINIPKSEYDLFYLDTDVSFSVNFSVNVLGGNPVPVIERFNDCIVMAKSTPI